MVAVAYCEEAVRPGREDITERILEKIIQDKAVIQAESYLRPMVEDYCKKHIAEEIEAELKEFFDEHDYLDIEGYVRFRAAGHIRHINMFTLALLKKQMVKSQYESFIADMRSYVSQNEPRRELLQISYQDGGLDLFDEHGRSLINEARFYYYCEFRAAEEKNTDSVFHYLLKLLPERILLYANESSNFLKTVQLVFGERVELRNEPKP